MLSNKLHSNELQLKLIHATDLFMQCGMDLDAIKLLLRYPRGTTEHLAGVDGFLEFAYKDKLEDTKISCPCEDCVHTIITTILFGNKHLFCKNFEVC
jgi:hypothetical protein